MIALGSTNASKVYLGNEEISKIYLGSTQIWGGSSPTPVPPYDAEVEYLESTGSEYIDTSIAYDSTVVVDAKLNVTGTTDGTVFGIYTNDNGTVNRWALMMTGSNKRAVPHFGTITNKYISISLGTDYTVNATYNVLKVNNTTKSTGAAAFSVSSPVSIYLFARHNWQSAGVDTVDSNRQCKLYWLKITKGGVVVRDFIPVRVGTTGYLYDKISGQLFGNSGTGDFTYGNDVTT